ncbi:MAG: hypothetical protein H6736_10415 [Alphaproteobacteria bacterium]|nr:hypothetical protein [Alphaproteobacteria bacterium]MCB9692214.1 hypothetical protein [Alphaproteobacteria bacterium]
MLVLLTTALAECLVVKGVDAGGATLAVRMDDGRVTATGQVSSVGCTVPELPTGAVITPGLVAVNSTIGLSEVGMEDATVELMGDGDPIRPTLRVADAYDPASVHVPVMRLGGITSAVLNVWDGLIAGQSGWVRLAGATQAEAVVAREVAVVGSVGGRSRALQLDRLAEVMEEARVYAANKGKVTANAFREFPEGLSVRDLEALGPVARGERPLVVGADRASDIEAVLRMGQQQGLKLVISGAAEGWKVRDQLAATRTPVIVDPLVYGAGSFDQVHGRPDNAALLAEAGVTVMFESWTHNSPILAQLAGNAVRGGMDHQAALDAITVNPGKAFGVPGYDGLKPGNAGDLVAWSGDPLEIGSRPLLVVVNGEVQPLDSRQKALLRRYRELPGSPVPALSLPQ